MAGIDFTRASIEERECVAFVRGQVENIISRVKEVTGVTGCVLLSTCNRTELYVNTTNSETSPLSLLCWAAGLAETTYRDKCVYREDTEAVRHLMRVASGLESQIFGDDQILSQVRDAQTLARSSETLDSVLDTMFRRAVTAGKRVRTGTRLKGVPSSAAEQGVRKAEEFFGSLKNKRTVVIGNGEMGRLAAAKLRERGAEVWVTLRTYRHGETVVPAGCSAWAYDKRYELIENTDLVVSATTSPHYTLTSECMAALEHPPTLLIDLAIPRDIEQKIAENAKIRVLNLDDLGDLGESDPEGYEFALGIIEEEEKEFFRWLAYRESLPVMEQIKGAALSRLRHDHAYAGLVDDKDFQGLEELAVNKTVDLIFGGLKELVSPEHLANCLANIKKGKGK